MILPLYDENPTRTFPIMTILLIIANVFVFLLESSLPSAELESFIRAFAFIPSEFVKNAQLSSIFTAMFMHGGFIHIAGNMLYLWIFGNNIEDALGHFKFLLFYLTCGLVATLAQFVVDPASTVPTLGASGAIAGVLGGYLLLYPSAQIVSLVPLLFFVTLYRLPAIIVIGLWFVIQFANGYFSLQASSAAAGIAWFAHIGGFISGILLIMMISKKRIRKKLFRT